MSDATKRYRDRLHADAQANADRYDPAKMMDSLRRQGVWFVQTQMRTLIFEDPAQLERHLRTTPELAEIFICLVRADLEKQGLDMPAIVSEVN